MAATWPSLLRPTRPLIRFMIQNPSRSGGVSLNGMEQTVASGAERWQAQGSFLCLGKAAILDFERFLVEMSGRGNEVAVPTYSGRQANWPLQYHNGAPTGRVLHPGNTRNKALNGTAYADAEIPSASEIVATAGAASLNATSIVITVTQGRAIAAGQLFGIGQRLYRAMTVTAPVAGAQTVTFRPKLRAAVSGGATVLFTRPVCLMKFASDDQGQELDILSGGPVTLNFVEAF